MHKLMEMVQNVPVHVCFASTLYRIHIGTCTCDMWIVHIYNFAGLILCIEYILCDEAFLISIHWFV